MNERLAKVVEAIKAKKQVEEAKRTEIVERYKAKAKVKALTTTERLDRIEELLGLKDAQ